MRYMCFLSLLNSLRRKFSIRYIASYLSQNSLLSKFQSGFRPKHTQLYSNSSHPNVSYVARKCGQWQVKRCRVPGCQKAI